MLRAGILAILVLAQLPSVATGASLSRGQALKDLRTAFPKAIPDEVELDDVVYIENADRRGGESILASNGCLRRLVTSGLGENFSFRTATRDGRGVQFGVDLTSRAIPFVLGNFKRMAQPHSNFDSRVANVSVGERVVDEVTSITAPTPRDGFTVSQVTFRWHPVATPFWGLCSEPPFALDSVHEAKAWFALTDTGWKVKSWDGSSMISGGAVVSKAAAPASVIGCDRAQAETIASIEVMRSAVLAWVVDNAGAVPVTPGASVQVARYTSVSAEKFTELLTPNYIDQIDVTDGWGHKLNFFLAQDLSDEAVAQSGTGPRNVVMIRSPGADGAYESGSYELSAFSGGCSNDIVWADGVWVRWPR